MAPGFLWRCLWKALDKEAGGDWTGMTSNQLSNQVWFTFEGFSCGVFVGLHRGKMGECAGTCPTVSVTSPCTGSLWCPWDLPTQLESQEQLEAMPRIPVPLCHGLPDHDGSSIAGSGFYFYCYFRQELPHRRRAEVQAAQQPLQQPSNPFCSPALQSCPRNPVESHPRMSCAPSTSLSSISSCFITPKHDVLHPSYIFYFL